MTGITKLEILGVGRLNFLSFQVERAFRSLKTIDLKVRPIHHRLERRVRPHIFLCMLAYYVEWHMREAWRELMFADTELAAKATRDPVAPGKRSASAQTKAASRTLADGSPTHSFATPMAELAMIVRNTLSELLRSPCNRGALEEEPSRATRAEQSAATVPDYARPNATGSATGQFCVARRNRRGGCRASRQGAFAIA